MNYKKIKKKIHGFTLIEMLIVLIIIWILTIFSLWISNDQVQKVRNKTVKESILAEWLSRYSRNLWSSSFSWTIYKHMDIELSSWSNEIKVWYYLWNNTELFSGTFTNRFLIKNISWNNENLEKATLEYTPYRIACKIKKWEIEDNELNKITLTINVNDQENADYCFEINKNNCRLIEVPSSRCWIEPFNY